MQSLEKLILECPEKDLSPYFLWKVTYGFPVGISELYKSLRKDKVYSIVFNISAFCLVPGMLVYLLLVILAIFLNEKYDVISTEEAGVPFLVATVVILYSLMCLMFFSALMSGRPKKIFYRLGKLQKVIENIAGEFETTPASVIRWSGEEVAHIKETAYERLITLAMAVVSAEGEARANRKPIETSEDYVKAREQFKKYHAVLFPYDIVKKSWDPYFKEAYHRLGITN